MKHGFDGIIMLFVGLAIAIIMVANVVLPTIAGVDTTDWDTGAAALWSIVGLVIVASLILMVFGGRRR